jgi:hypothetical protein
MAPASPDAHLQRCRPRLHSYRGVILWLERRCAHVNMWSALERSSWEFRIFVIECRDYSERLCRGFWTVCLPACYSRAEKFSEAVRFIFLACACYMPTPALEIREDREIYFAWLCFLDRREERTLMFCCVSNTREHKEIIDFFLLTLQVLHHNQVDLDLR